MRGLIRADGNTGERDSTHSCCPQPGDTRTHMVAMQPMTLWLETLRRKAGHNPAHGLRCFTSRVSVFFVFFLDIKPGSFICTVQVTSKFLRLERLSGETAVACDGDSCGPWRWATDPRPGTQVALPRQGPGPTPRALAAILPEVHPFRGKHTTAPETASCCH